MLGFAALSPTYKTQLNPRDHQKQSTKGPPSLHGKGDRGKGVDVERLAKPES